MRSNLSSAASMFMLGSLIIVPQVLALSLRDMDMDMGMDMGGHDDHSDHNAPSTGASHGHALDPPKDESEYPDTYFGLSDHATMIYAHILLMTIAWVVVLPVAVMLSLAKSRYTIFTQFVFLATNALGVVLAVIYNGQTPDLYPNNAHHKIGWIITAVVCAQGFIAMVGWLAGVLRTRQSSPGAERHAFLSIPNDSDGTLRPSMSYRDGEFRLSGESGEGSERRPDSLRSESVSTQVADEEEGLPMPSPHKEYADDDDLESVAFSEQGSKGKLAARAGKIASSRVWKYMSVAYNVIDRIILPFGFIAFATGLVAFCRFFEGSRIFAGLAHWIKGGVFFWLGILTLGRWAGSFAEIGWAWNLRPHNPKWRPSCEFVESFLIFFYGCTNIFLEHLGHAGGSWTAQDLEHFSITILFIGGGAIGMLVESTWIRDLLNTNTNINAAANHAAFGEDRERREPPKTYGISLNPMPALIILLLGIMMSSHQQTTMTSTMIHKQWGNLLSAGAFARGLTYVIMYLKPPTSTLPSRPPTELLAAFGLIGGGLIFMASSTDNVNGMIHYGVDPMALYTVTMGFVGLLMAWVLVVLAIKGWATRQEQHRTRR